MEQIHSCITKETKRYLETIAKENNDTLNGVVSLATNKYI